MKLTSEEGRCIVFDEHGDWVSIKSPEIIETSRWSIRLTQVFRHVPTKKYYRLCWSEGATEQQDELPFEYETPEPIEVVQKEVKVLQWVPAN